MFTVFESDYNEKQIMKYDYETLTPFMLGDNPDEQYTIFISLLYIHRFGVFRF